MQIINTFHNYPDFVKDIDAIIEQKQRQKRRRIYNFSTYDNDLKNIPTSGFGRCRSCDCTGYISKHNGTHECKNCQHHFDRHY